MAAHRSTPRTLKDIPAAVDDRLSKVRAGGLGLGGLVVLSIGVLNSQLVADAPTPLLDTFVVVLVIAGLVLAYTYAGLSNCRRHVQSLRVEDADWPVEEAQTAYSRFEHEDPGDKVIDFQSRTISGSAAIAADEFRIAIIGYRLSLILVGVSVVLFLWAVVTR